MNWIHRCLLPFGFLTSLAAQQAVAKPPSIEQQRVTDIIRFLASDELAGRDTPSKGLDKAADYIAAAFRSAGLSAFDEQKTFFRTYQRPGQQIDANACKVVLHLEDGGEGVSLAPGKDVRVFRAPGNAFAREDTDVIVVDAKDAARRLRRSAARSPILMLVDPKTSPLWKAVAGKRSVLTRRRGLSRVPILLVRKGAMPEGDIDHAEVTVAAAKKVSLQLKNVVGYLPGGKRKGEFVVLSAHYDHVGVGMPVIGDGIYIGADDDATGTTAVVALAEAFARSKQKLDRSLLFVCYSGEEKGLLGSHGFAADPPVRLEDLVVNVNIEMIGRPDQIKPKQAWITGEDLSDFAAIAKTAFARAGIEVVYFRMASMLFRASDNFSLAQKGVVAHSISAGSLHGDYHQPSDQVKKLDLPNMTAVIRGLFEVALEFANRETRPAYNKQGRRVLRLDK